MIDTDIFIATHRSRGKPLGNPRRCGWLALTWLLFAVVPSARAQDSAEGEGEGEAETEAAAEAGEADQPPPPTAVPAADVPRVAEETSAELAEMRENAEPVSDIGEIEEALPGLSRALQQLAATQEETIRRRSSLRHLDDMRQEWARRESELDGHRSTLEARAGALAENLEELAQSRSRWELTQEELDEGDLPDAMRGTIREVLRDIGETESVVGQRLESVSSVQVRVGATATGMAEALRELEDAEEALRSALFRRDAAPLWASPWDDAGAAIGSSFAAASATLAEFVELQQVRTITHLVLLLFFIIATIWLNRSVDGSAETTAPLERISLMAAIATGLLLAWFVYEEPPSLILDLAAALAVVPVLAAQPRRIALVSVGGLGLAFAITRALALVDTGLTFRFVAVGVCLICLLCIGALRFMSRGQTPRSLLVLSVLLSGAGMVTNVVGYSRLALVITSGLSGMLWWLIVSRTLRDFGVATVRRALRTRISSTSHAIEEHRVLIDSRAIKLVRLSAVLLWVAVSLESFSLLTPTKLFAMELLETSWSFGTVEVSVLDLLAFCLTLVASYLISKLLGFILDEDVLPRMPLGRGVAPAISMIVRYLVLGGGVVLAVAAAGVELDRLALLGGALGVGIGFGLQNVVSNFVSGLILIFERPVKIGDTVELGTVLGEVTRIGIRASSIRIANGAEVIVPNTDLISNQVINWTHSDRRRRIDLAVGVAYGTEPSAVKELLLEIAHDHEAVLDEPAPAVLFQAMGASSLDFELRAWTAEFQGWLRVRSELNAKVYEALNRANIEIPFPQQDVHLRSNGDSEPDTPDADSRTSSEKEPS